MPKPRVAGNAQRTRGRGRSAELRNGVEGQIEEICHELALQVKRMRQLQDQATELRTVIGEWAGGSE